MNNLFESKREPNLPEKETKMLWAGGDCLIFWEINRIACGRSNLWKFLELAETRIALLALGEIPDLCQKCQLKFYHFDLAPLSGLAGLGKMLQSDNSAANFLQT